MILRLYVQIPTQYTRWAFFASICCNTVYCLIKKDQKQIKKRPVAAHLLKMLESDGGNGGNHFWLGKILGHIGDLCLSVKKMVKKPK